VPWLHIALYGHFLSPRMISEFLLLVFPQLIDHLVAIFLIQLGLFLTPFEILLSSLLALLGLNLSPP